MQKMVRQPDVPFREPDDFPDPPRFRDPVTTVCGLLKILIALNAVNVICTLSLWLR